MPSNAKNVCSIVLCWYVHKNVLKNIFTCVAKMTSHAIFQYNVLVIDIDNTTLGQIWLLRWPFSGF